ncbi:MAG: ABC transporter ATP-binding protein [Polyangia bacterium]
MSLLRVQNLVCGYGKQPLLGPLNLDLEKGDALVIVGANGAGKSTLMRTLCGGLPALEGSVSILGDDVQRLRPRQRAKLVAMLPQIQPLDPSVTVEDLALLGRTPHLGNWGRVGLKDRRTVERSIDLCGLTGLRSRQLGQISGGERQRARLAMVLAQETPLVLLDEPTNHLDMRRRWELHEILSAVRAERGCATTIVSHSLEDARRFGERALLVSAGAPPRAFDAEQRNELLEALQEDSGVPSEWVY